MTHKRATEIVWELGVKEHAQFWSTDREGYTSLSRSSCAKVKNTDMGVGFIIQEDVECTCNADQNNKALEEAILVLLRKTEKAN